MRKQPYGGAYANPLGPWTPSPLAAFQRGGGGRSESAEHPSVIWRNTVLAPRMAANRAEADRLNEERDFIPSVTANGRRYNRERRKAASFVRCGFCGGSVERMTAAGGDLFACVGCHREKRAKAGAQ